MEDGHRQASEIRLSDADRDAVIAQLTEATDAGRITLLEFEERAGQVYAAQFPSQLTPVTADLPLPASKLPAPQPAIQDAVATPVERHTRWAFQIFGGNQRRGNWDPGGQTKSLTIFGEQTLDLTEVEATSVDLKTFSIFSSTYVIVPDGARTDVDGFNLFGGTSNTTKAASAGSSDMVVRVRAYAIFGGCTVRNLKRRERKKRGLPPR